MILILGISILRVDDENITAVQEFYGLSLSLCAKACACCAFALSASATFSFSS